VRLVISLALLWTGCFYIDPIETHPTVTLFPASTVQVTRGGQLTVTAQLEHPDTFAWSAFACEDRDGFNCSASSFYVPVAGTPTGSAVLAVPVRVSGESSPLTQSIVVEVVARDDHGAIALGGATQRYSVEDAAPMLDVSSSAHSYTVGAPIEVFATYSDLDDELADITLRAMVVTPLPAISLEAGSQAQLDSTHITVTQRLVPNVAGSWVVEVTATDRAGMAMDKTLALEIAADQPPCIAQARPLVPPEGVTLPITESTLFQIPLVDDDLDGYPPVSSDPLYGTASFEWSILPPGASERVALPGTSGNRVPFDPGLYTPGQIVELRVEVFDRHHTAVSCPDEMSTCALTTNDGCTQRQTWRLEIR